MSAIDNVPLRQLLQFAKSYDRLGFSIQEQIEDLVQYGNRADINGIAVEEVLLRLRPMPKKLKSICEAYLESLAEEALEEETRFNSEAEESASGGRYASSDAALRGRLIRLAHTRPDLREHLLPLLTDKAACGWDGAEGTVMAKHEKGVSVDPTKDMSPEDAAEWKKQNAINKDKFTKGATSALRMISDPRHGWLEVPVSELTRLGIARQITHYSYRKGQMAYLEEDQDAGTYIQALEDAGEPRPQIIEVYQEYTPIRNYPSYR